jgi:drug/metabolite transporter (DMT)-like permease
MQRTATPFTPVRFRPQPPFLFCSVMLPSMTNYNKAYIYALVSVLFWSTAATAFKIALAHLDIFQLLFYASLASTLILLLPILFNDQIGILVKEAKVHWKRCLLIAALNPLSYYLILFAAYDRLPAQIAQPINYTWAIVLTFMSVIFLRQRPLLSDYLAAFICYAGVVVISQGGLDNFADSHILGLILAILSTFVWASYWILNVNDPRNQAVAMCLNFLFALPITALLCFTMSSFTIDSIGLASAIYIGIFEMGLAFLFWSKALRMAENTSRVSTLIFLAPFISLVFIQQILNETIQSSTYLGLGIIIFGLVLQRVGVSRQLEAHSR